MSYGVTEFGSAMTLSWFAQNRHFDLAGFERQFRGLRFERTAAPDAGAVAASDKMLSISPCSDAVKFSEILALYPYMRFARFGASIRSSGPSFPKSRK